MRLRAFFTSGRFRVTVAMCWSTLTRNVIEGSCSRWVIAHRSQYARHAGPVWLLYSGHSSEGPAIRLGIRRRALHGVLDLAAVLVFMRGEIRAPGVESQAATKFVFASSLPVGFGQVPEDTYELVSSDLQLVELIGERGFRDGEEVTPGPLVERGQWRPIADQDVVDAG